MGANYGEMVMLRFRDEVELRKHGLAIDPSDPSRAVPIGQLGLISIHSPPGEPEPTDEMANAGDGSPESLESFTRNCNWGRDRPLYLGR